MPIGILLLIIYRYSRFSLKIQNLLYSPCSVLSSYC